MIDPERFIEAEIASRTEARVLVLMACACAKIAVMASCKDERILADALRSMWIALTGEATSDACRELIRYVERLATTQRWKSAQWFAAHSVVQAAAAVLMFVEGFERCESLFRYRIVSAVRLARFGIDPLISPRGDRQLCARMAEILEGKRKAA